jgi:hypothetical protein
LSERPSLSVSVKPSILPSPFASIPPASVTSVMPSLSESTSTAIKSIIFGVQIDKYSHLLKTKIDKHLSLGKITWL